MNLIILSPFQVVPPNFGGARRIFSIANEIAKKDLKTHLIAPEFDTAFNSNGWKFKYHFKYHSIHPLISNLFYKFYPRAGSIYTMHLFIDQFCELKKIIKEDEDKNKLLLQGEQIFSIYPLYIIKKLYNIPLIITEHNVEGLLAKNVSNIYSSYLIFLEKIFLKKCDHVVCVSEIDKNIFISSFGVPKEKISVIPNGVDTMEFRKKDKSESRQLIGEDKEIPIVLFMGALSYYPNTDAVKIIKRIILPNVRKEIPDVKFIIVGKGHAPQKSRDLIFTGLVNDVVPYINAADVTIVPLLKGGGTRLKILEFFACEKTVISTTEGAEGLDVEDNTNIIISDNWSDFSNNIISLLSDEKKNRTLGKNARKLVEKKYSWDKCAESYIKIYEEVIEK